VLLRNYPPQDSFTIVWDCEGGGYCFRVDDGILPQKRTSGNGKKAQPAMVSYLPIAQEIFSKNSGCMEVGPFKAIFKEATGLSDRRIRDFVSWAQAGGKPFIEAVEERGRGLYRKTLRMKNHV